MTCVQDFFPWLVYRIFFHELCTENYFHDLCTGFFSMTCVNEIISMTCVQEIIWFAKEVLWIFHKLCIWTFFSLSEFSCALLSLFIDLMFSNKSWKWIICLEYELSYAICVNFYLLIFFHISGIQMVFFCIHSFVTS